MNELNKLLHDTRLSENPAFPYISNLQSALVFAEKSHAALPPPESFSQDQIYLPRISPYPLNIRFDTKDDTTFFIINKISVEKLEDDIARKYNDYVGIHLRFTFCI